MTVWPAQILSLHNNSWQVGTYRTSSTALQQVPRLTLAHWTCAPLQQLTSRRSSQSAVRMFPRDAEFATQQLQSIVAELRADPALSPILDDRKVAAAIKDIAANPTSLQKHANNPKVMRVLQRLLGQDLAAREAAAFADAGTTPADLFNAMSADAELSSLLQDSSVRTAIAHIRANPQAGMAKWGSDSLVTRALDLLEAALGTAQGTAGGLGAVVDVVAEEVKRHHQQQGQQQQLLVQEGGKVVNSRGRLRKRGSIFR